MKNLIALSFILTSAFPFSADASSENLSQNSLCKFNSLILPSDFAVFATGAYRGRDTSIQIDQSGKSASRMDIVVNYSEKPVVLMLGANDSTLWNISWSSNTNIIAVYASGYNRQAIAGLYKNTPILISTYDNHGACGYSYISEENIQHLNPLARELFGKPVNMVYPAKNGYATVGNPLSSDIDIITSTDTPPESFIDNTAPIAGLAGLEDAVNKGLLRKATSQDYDEWLEAVEKKSSPQDTPPVASGSPLKAKRIFFYNAYVVLKPFTYPAGLYGAQAATFIIPLGMQKPTGNPGHSITYDYNTMKCDGAVCNAH